MTDTPSASTDTLAGPECRNCGAVATCAYCPHCGQETSLALPTVRSMLREAAGRYVALDGRMWRTLIGLLFRPGFLTREYFAGRRRRYVRPARLFLVLSIGLFALLRIVGEPPHFGDVAAPAADEKGSAKGNKKGTQRDIEMGTSDLANLQLDFGNKWLDPLRQRAAQFNRLPQREQTEQIFAGVMRYGPYAMVALLPLFALLMQILYFGRARRYPLRPRRYAAHLVFGAHNHAFMFLVVALFVLLPVGPLRFALGLWAIVYLLRSMRAVYGGRWSGVFARAAVLCFAYVIFFAFVVAGLVVAAIVLR